VSFSNDNNYMSVAHSTSPFVTIYKRIGDTFTKLANPSILPTNGANFGNGVSFSNDNNYMSVAHYASPYITIYKRSGDTFTKLNNPSELPAGTVNGVAFSNDNNYMSVAHSTSPYVTIYKREIVSYGIYPAFNSVKEIFSGLGYVKKAGATGQTIDMVSIFR